MARSIPDGRQWDNGRTPSLFSPCPGEEQAARAVSGTRQEAGWNSHQPVRLPPCFFGRARDASRVLAKLTPKASGRPGSLVCRTSGAEPPPLVTRYASEVSVGRQVL
jgi:hypothetical protein